MKQQVCGLIFSKPEPGRKRLVLLIGKTHPAWMAGKFNCIGGGVEPGESPIQALVREVKEEADLRIPESEWTYYLDHTTDHGTHLHWFFCCIERNRLLSYQSPTEEQVTDAPVDHVMAYDGVELETLPALRWQMAMALSFERGESCQVFKVVEVPKP